jgi:hypothetical protein
MNYCKCKNPEPEEWEIGMFACGKCNKEMPPRAEDAPEPDEDGSEEYREQQAVDEERIAAQNEAISLGNFE